MGIRTAAHRIGGKHAVRIHHVAHQSARLILFVALLNGIKFAPIGLWVIAHHVEEQLNFRLTSTTMV